MNSFILAFLLGDLWLQTFAALPSLFFSFTVILISIILWMTLNNKTTIAILPIAFALGFTWTGWYAHSVSSWTLKKEWEGKPLIATGTISSLPHPGKFGSQFEFHLQKLNNFSTIEYPDSFIKLTWPQKSQVLESQIHSGDKWQLLVKLKRIHAVQSPGGYDYEAWALQKGIRASGMTRESRINKILSHGQFTHLLMTLRERLRDKILLYSPHTPTSTWLMALIVGERNGISQQDWQVLRNTGTNHLMAIGGLHIGILASFAYAMTVWLWRLRPSLALIIPARQMGTCVAFVMAVLYSALSGFSLPSERAVIMLSVLMFAMLARRQINPWNAWSFALFSVLIINPITVLSESFWLSFGTIALILYGMSHRLSPSGIWWKYARVQWVIGVGLIPLTLALYQQCSLVSFIANTVAIPWLGIAILPLCFLSAIFVFISPSLAYFLLMMADKSLAGLWQILSMLSHYHLASFHAPVPDIASLILMMTGFLLLLLPAGIPGRWLGVVWVLPVLLYQPLKPLQGEYWMTLLDVGQGLSVVIQTKTHTLVYDAGPKYEAASDMGESIVLPYLRSIKTNNIDMLVISHGDNDHIGGMNAILNSYPHTPIKTSVPDKILSSHVGFCNAGESFQWDHVTFTFLYPFNHDTNHRNDSSCVLMIDNGQYKVLLPGDIEKHAERDLLMNIPDTLAANILVAPHHGSKTSGIPEFISAVHPQIVLYATGYRNRYHFPHQSVVTSYEMIRAKSYNTVDTGTIIFKIPHEGTMLPPEMYRIENQKYWFDM